MKAGVFVAHEDDPVLLSYVSCSIVVDDLFAKNRLDVAF